MNVYKLKFQTGYTIITLMVCDESINHARIKAVEHIKKYIECLDIELIYAELIANVMGDGGLGETSGRMQTELLPKEYNVLIL